MFAASIVEKSSEGAQAPSGDEEIGGAAHRPPDPQADPHEDRGVDEEDGQVQRHCESGLRSLTRVWRYGFPVGSLTAFTVNFK